MSFNLAIMLRESASAAPDKAFLRFPSGTMTFAEVDTASGRLAGALRQHGLAPGDKVAVRLANVPEFVIAYFGILKAGLTMVPLNPLLKSAELAYHLDDSDARMLISGDTLAGEVVTALRQLADIALVRVGGADARPSEGSRPNDARTSDASPNEARPGQERQNDARPDIARPDIARPDIVWPDGSTPFGRLLDCHDDGDIWPTSADDTAVLLYTSGTTGQPKGAEISHFQLYMNCTLASERFGLDENDVCLAVLPFFHVYGLSSVLNAAVRHGRCISVLPRFQATAALSAIERDRITILAGVPTMYHALAYADASGYDTSSLRIASSGGAAIPEQVLRAFEAKYGIPILEGYGLSESASTATVNPGADERKVLSIGKPIWGIQLRIADENDESLPSGADQVGEILLRGHNITKGYYKRPRETAEAFRGGWFHTGDLGYQDDEGFVYVVDRKKDLIIRGGMNVYPREVEELLYRHPAVAEAAVLGRPDERLGEEVVAVVSLKDGAQASGEDISAWAKERIASYKYPRQVRVVDELPKGATGKITKRLLRE